MGRSCCSVKGGRQYNGFGPPLLHQTELFRETHIITDRDADRTEFSLCNTYFIAGSNDT